jgi:hypothetical protein
MAGESAYGADSKSKNDGVIAGEAKQSRSIYQIDPSPVILDSNDTAAYFRLMTGSAPRNDGWKATSRSRSSNSKIRKSCSRMGRMFLVILVFAAFAFSMALADSQPAAKRFSYAIDGKIVKGTWLTGSGGSWVDATSLARALESFGASASLDQGAKLLAVGMEGAPGMQGAPAGNAFTIVLNGKITKIACIVQKDQVFVPLDAAVALFKGLGARSAEADKDAALLSVSGRASQASAASPTPAAATATTATPSPGSSAETAAKEPAKADPAHREKVRVYLDSLKKIFNGNKPNALDQEKIDQAILAVGSGGKFDARALNQIRKKYASVIGQIKGLSPPDQETSIINELAAQVFMLMDEVLGEANRIFTAGEHIDIPSALDKIRLLNSAIDRISRDFDQRVRDVRQRYRLGPP